MNVRTSFKIHEAAVKKIDKAVIKSLEQTAEALHTDVVQAQVMPRDTGHLQNESTFVDMTDSKRGKVKIVSTTPYARRLYYHPEYHFRTVENPNARGKWYDEWLTGTKKDFCQNAFAEFLRRNGGF